MEYAKNEDVMAVAKDNTSGFVPMTRESVSLEVSQVEHYDFFGDVIAFWLDISGVPQSIQVEAQRIDRDNFNPDCFGICVNYILEEREFVVVIDTERSVEHPGNLYYIDIDGTEHWFTVELPKAFVKQAFLKCVEAVANEDYSIKPSKQDAEKSSA